MESSKDILVKHETRDASEDAWCAVKASHCGWYWNTAVTILGSEKYRNISNEVPEVNIRNYTEGQNKKWINTKTATSGKSGRRY
jgi:hypothetical protein